MSTQIGSSGGNKNIQTYDKSSLSIFDSVPVGLARICATSMNPAFLQKFLVRAWSHSQKAKGGFGFGMLDNFFLRYISSWIIFTPLYTNWVPIPYPLYPSSITWNTPGIIVVSKDLAISSCFRKMFSYCHSSRLQRKKATHLVQQLAIQHFVKQ